MQERKGFERFAPLTGVLFFVLLIAAVVVGGEAPSYKEPQLEIVEFWKDDETSQIISAVLGAWAAFMLVWFGASVRDAIARKEPGPSRLASISFAGAVITAVGLLLFAGLSFTAADTAGKVSADVTQTLTALNEDLFFPVAVGTALFLTAAGIAAIRYGAFDRWLGWIALAIGLICITPIGFFGILAAIAWILIASIVLYRKKDPVGSGAEPPPSSGPSIEIPPGAGPPAPS
jgi:hypothetical protein